MPFAILHEIERQYDADYFNSWIQRNWTLSVVASAVYLLSIWLGTKWMKHRQPFKLSRVLLAWNVGLAVFSILGTYNLVPGLYYTLVTDGFTQTVCWTDVYQSNYRALWSAFFTLSKLLELFDTVFIVLRKTPLIFLHYYHHVTVMIYAWYGHSTKSSIGLWFGCMNYAVHSFMYSYYALRACGVRVPQGVMQGITILQLAQMLMGLVCNIVGTHLLLTGSTESCAISWAPICVGYVIYASYAALFANFFYHRYLGSSKPKRLVSK